MVRRSFISLVGLFCAFAVVNTMRFRHQSPSKSTTQSSTDPIDSLDPFDRRTAPRDPNRTPPRNPNPPRTLTSLLKSTRTVLADPKLIITNPLNNAILIANNTYAIQVTSDPLTPGPATVTTTFICTSGNFTVQSDINDATSFLVPPNVSGTCTVTASAPSYTTSDPITVFLQVPLYYEGTDESVLKQGETIDILVRPSNDAVFPTTFRIQCGATITDIPITTTIVTKYTIPPTLKGDCNFTTPFPPNPYLPIEPVDVTIEATITIISPTQNTIFPAGSFISVAIQTSDGSNPVITIELTCENVLAATLTQPARSVFNFAPNQNIYGSCVISIADKDTYYTEQTVNIGYNVNLNFAVPVAGTVAAIGIPFGVQVTGTSGLSSTSVTITGTCDVGGSFVKYVNLNQFSEITLDPGYTGRCTLVASVNNPYFSTASTFIFVFVPLTPQESAQEAVSLAFFSGTIDLTVSS